jgi:hypothetical protein
LDVVVRVEGLQNVVRLVVITVVYVVLTCDITSTAERVSDL